MLISRRTEKKHIPKIIHCFVSKSLSFCENLFINSCIRFPLFATELTWLLCSKHMSWNSFIIGFLCVIFLPSNPKKICLILVRAHANATTKAKSGIYALLLQRYFDCMRFVRLINVVIWVWTVRLLCVCVACHNRKSQVSRMTKKPINQYILAQQRPMPMYADSSVFNLLFIALTTVVQKAPFGNLRTSEWSLSFLMRCACVCCVNFCFFCYFQ